MNLVLAVIVDFAVDAREDDTKMKVMMQDKLRADAKKQLNELCKELDEDNNRTLTQEEFMQAFDSPGFQEVMVLLGIDREDLTCVFRIMDKDCSGDVSYSE